MTTNILAAILVPQIMMVLVFFLIWVAIFPQAVADFLTFKKQSERLESCLLYVFLFLPVVTWLIIKQI